MPPTHKVDEAEAARMRAAGKSVIEIAQHFNTTRWTVYKALERHDQSQGAPPPVHTRVKALRPWDFAPYGTGPGSTHTSRMLTIAASYNLDASSVVAGQLDKMAKFVRGLAEDNEVIVFTGKPPAYFKRARRTADDADLMIRPAKDRPLTAEQAAAWRIPTLPEDEPEEE